MKNLLEISFNCYLCGSRNTVSVDPLKQEMGEGGTLTLYYAETIHFTCPYCGLKYAIPNSEMIKTVPQHP